jgi:amidase
MTHLGLGSADVSDLMLRPAGELASLVRGGEISARELVQDSLDRIEALDGTVNAFVEYDGERALVAADAVHADDPRPFAGVPIAVKVNTPVEGFPMHFGSRFLAGHRAQHNAYLVRRLLDAGFIVVGVTNMPEFGILPTTEPRFTGITRNPWDLDRTPGGSSGGSAAAVAAGMVPLAHANDGGGSIRIPAACCGLVGLKTSRGRISRGPDLGDNMLGTDGVLTRTVGETAALLDVMAGYEVGDATWAPPPLEPYAVAARRPPGRLRIACTLSNPLDADVHPEWVRALHDTRETLEALGHEVFESRPVMPGPEGLALFLQVFAPQIGLGMKYGEMLAGRPPEPDELEPLSWAFRELAAGIDSVSYLTAVAQAQALSRAAIASFADYDVLMTPPLASRPLRIGEIHGSGEDPWADFARTAQFAPYAALFNITGQPALNLPVGLGDDGLPVSVQLVGRPLAEDTLLRLATQLEAVLPVTSAVPQMAGDSR